MKNYSTLIWKLIVVLAVSTMLTCQRPEASRQIKLTPVPDTLGVEIRFPGVEGVLSTTMPELVNDPTRRLIYVDANLKRVEWRTDHNGGLHSEWREQGLGSYELHALPERDGVFLRWRVTNLSDEIWPDVAGNICMRSHPLPDFFDPTGERIFFRSEGHWVSAREAGPVGGTWYLPPGREAIPLMKPHLEQGSYRISDFRPDEAIIAVRSKDGRYVLAQAWPESQYLLANIHPHYVCTEAPPAFGDIGAGETVEVTGKIYFLEGTIDQLADAYRRDLSAGKIALRREVGGR